PMQRKIFEQRVLLSRQVNAPARASRRMVSGVQNQIGDLHHGGSKIPNAPQEGANSRQQFFKLERLDQIVVSAAVQTFDAVVNRVTRRQHENGRVDSARTQFAANLIAVFTRQHHVQNDQVVIVYLSLIERRLALRYDVDGVTFLAQPFGHKSGHARFVFDQQNSHSLTPCKTLSATAL